MMSDYLWTRLTVFACFAAADERGGSDSRVRCVRADCVGQDHVAAIRRRETYPSFLPSSLSLSISLSARCLALLPGAQAAKEQRLRELHEAEGRRAGHPVCSLLATSTMADDRRCDWQESCGQGVLWAGVAPGVGQGRYSACMLAHQLNERFAPGSTQCAFVVCRCCSRKRWMWTPFSATRSPLPRPLRPLPPPGPRQVCVGVLENFLHAVCVSVPLIWCCACRPSGAAVDGAEIRDRVAAAKRGPLICFASHLMVPRLTLLVSQDKNLIDRAASFVSKLGHTFEKLIMEREGNNPKCANASLAIRIAKCSALAHCALRWLAGFPSCSL